MDLRHVKASQHGIGHLLNPTDPESEDRDWIDDAWTYVIAVALEQDAIEPPWIDAPAVTRITVANPELRKLFQELNKGLSYTQQIKPFNFMLVAFVHVGERPANDQRMVLVAPYSKDRREWMNLPWVNRYSGAAYKITTEPSAQRERDGIVTVKTYRDILNAYAEHPERKSADANGIQCREKTRGLLARRCLTASTLIHIGKESNELEAVQSGLSQDQRELLNEYDDPEQLYFEQVVLPRLRTLGPREVARRTGNSLGAVHAVLIGKAVPRPDSMLSYKLAVDGSSNPRQP